MKRAEDFLIAAYWNLLKHNQDEAQAEGQNAQQNLPTLDPKYF